MVNIIVRKENENCNDVQNIHKIFVTNINIYENER